jgi:hypothetical protein
MIDLPIVQPPKNPIIVYHPWVKPFHRHFNWNVNSTQIIRSLKDITIKLRYQIGKDYENFIISEGYAPTKQDNGNHAKGNSWEIFTICYFKYYHGIDLVSTALIETNQEIDKWYGIDLLGMNDLTPLIGVACKWSYGMFVYEERTFLSHFSTIENNLPAPDGNMNKMLRHFKEMNIPKERAFFFHNNIDHHNLFSTGENECWIANPRDRLTLYCRESHEDKFQNPHFYKWMIESVERTVRGV